ncbi:MAG: hypothetical protein N838_11325 [Thiohalocapsa sp. PB-PSB1]|nr:MAG: hypothetical protein N838_11325 [Thiohalocapsa sp. PB-PSB1]
MRPRRFGRSQWLSTLENRHDLAKTEQFEQLFGYLKIGQAPPSDLPQDTVATAS